MITDRYAFRHSSSETTAVAAFQQVVAAIAAHRPGAAALTSTLEHDPVLVGAHALKGLASVIMASDPSMQMARSQATIARAALRAARGGGSAHEHALVEALEHAATGHLNDAALRLEQHLSDHPGDFLAFKLAHALRFMSGRPEAMLATASVVLPHWTPAQPGYGYVIGCHAFSLEETGQFAEAERLGRHAISHAPDDVWALHAVAHVMEMGGRVRDGITWLRPTTGQWRTCGNFGGHLAWHLALFHVSDGDHSAALDLFDRYLKTEATCDFRDVANATSLLWRLEQEGVAVGDRWETVGRIAHARRQDTAYVFGALHSLLALIGSRQIPAAHELVAALRLSAARADADQSRVAGAIGVDLAETILAVAERRETRSPLTALAMRLPRMGGSIAQRDVFLRTLILIAEAACDDVAASQLRTLRLRQRKADQFLLLVDRRRSQRQPAMMDALRVSA